jgi:N-acetylglucosaminyldiphosphoundecaprenol N-acetyl-beta-D-mannosaminyltransferase
MAATPAPRRVRLLGGDVDLTTPGDMLRFAELTADAGGTALIANHNAHSLFLIRRSATMRAFFEEADLIQIDSTPMILWGRLLGLPTTRAMRSTYLDWREDFWRLAEARRWRVFYLGGAPGVAEAAVQRLAAAHPLAAIACHHGYFDQAPASPANRAVLAGIAAFDPDILFVGMGMPQQEAWVLENRASLKRGAIFTVGAAFDYEAGVQRTPPRWTGRLGVEWLARLFHEPRRLAYRYLVEPWSLLGPALQDVGAALARANPNPRGPLRGAPGRLSR